MCRGANNSVLIIVWKDSRSKKFVYDMSNVRKKSIQTVIQKGGWHKVRFTGFEY